MKSSFISIENNGGNMNKNDDSENMRRENVYCNFFGIYNADNPVDNYMFKVNNNNTKTRCEICSELTIKTPERRQWRRSGVFIVNFEHISHLVLVFLTLTLSR